MPSYGWKAQFDQEWNRDGYTLHLGQWRGDTASYAIGEIVMQEVGRVDTPPSGEGLFLPADAYRAIVTAIDPPAHHAELRRLEEALGVERARVDFALGRP